MKKKIFTQVTSKPKSKKRTSNQSLQLQPTLAEVKLLCLRLNILYNLQHFILLLYVGGKKEKQIQFEEQKAGSTAKTFSIYHSHNINSNFTM